MPEETPAGSAETLTPSLFEPESVPGSVLVPPVPDAEAARGLVEQRWRWRREGREYLEENFDKTLTVMLRTNALI